MLNNNKMLNDLITKTNTKEFYSNCNLYPISIKCQIGGFDTIDLEFVIEENSIDESEGQYHPLRRIEYWNIISHKTIEFNNLFAPIYIPYVKIRLLYDHPLLWKYKTDELECELSEVPENYNEFVGVIYHTFQKHAGNWLSINKSLFGLFRTKPEERKKALIIPEPMRQPIIEVCNEYSVGFKVTHVSSGEDKGYANRPDLKVLMFGNEDVSSYKSNSGQPYIIAEDFIANKK